MFSGPLDDGLEEEEEECVSEGNELAAKEEFSAEENFTADFETENLEDMEFFCAKGQRVKGGHFINWKQFESSRIGSLHDCWGGLLAC